MGPEMGSMPDEVEVLTQEQAQEVLRTRLQAVYASLTGMRDAWVLHRAQTGKENVWRKAQQMYEGKDPSEADTSMESYLREGPTRKKRTRTRSQVVVNIVAPKVDAVIARVCEILLPVDDRNWGIKPTPDPEMSEDLRSDEPMGVDSQGQPATVADGARAAQQASVKAAEAMTREIDDVLTECQYNGSQRRQIEDAVKLGTGVLKGPYPINRTTKRYVKTQGGFAADVVNEIRPASTFVDPWNIYPDPSCGNDHQRGVGIFESRPVTRKELRELVDIPGFDADAIREVLREAPKRVRVSNNKVGREKSQADESYEMWEYTGEIDPDHFGMLSLRTGLEDDKGDPLVVDRGVVIMVNDRVIGALPQWSDDLPYDFFVWNRDDDSPFGIGLPERLETQQRVINAAWRQVMDNAGLSAGPQLIINRNMITPYDGNWDIEPRKIWMAREDLDDARKAFFAVDFPTRTAELMKIVEAAQQMADQESNAPLLMQGDQGSAPDTVGGMTLLMNSANAPLRHKVKLFDDQVTRPHLRRYYHWFMEHSEKEEIKGDYEVDARGSSTLIERDIQNQAMANVAQLTANPVFGPLLSQKAPAALRAILKSFRVDPDDFVPSDDELEQQKAQQSQQPPPPDPNVIRSQMMLEAKKLEMEDRDEQRAFEAAMGEREMEYRMANLQYNQSREQAEHDIAMTIEQNKRDLELTKMAREEKLKISQLEAQVGMKHLDIDNKRQLFNAEAQIKARQGSGI